jgi:hypothetical protein
MSFMKKKAIFGMQLALLFLLAIPGTLAFCVEAKSDSGKRFLFADVFDGYAVGSFPSAGGWELWFSGAGAEYQKIVDVTSVSPTKSMQLLGVDNWAAFAAMTFVTDSSKIGFQVSVKVSEIRGGTLDSARLSFTRRVNSALSVEYAPILFRDNGEIFSGGQILQNYEANVWYRVTLLINRKTDTYSVWIDGVLRARKLTVMSTGLPESGTLSYKIQAFSVSQCSNNIRIYFDDVRVFSQLNPRRLM